MQINKKRVLLPLLISIFFIGVVCAVNPAEAKVLAKTKVNGKVIKITDTDINKINSGRSVEKKAGFKKYKYTVKKHGKKIKKTKKLRVHVTIDCYYEDGTKAPEYSVFVVSWTSKGMLNTKTVFIKEYARMGYPIG